MVIYFKFPTSNLVDWLAPSYAMLSRFVPVLHCQSTKWEETMLLQCEVELESEPPSFLPACFSLFFSRFVGKGT